MRRALIPTLTATVVTGALVGVAVAAGGRSASEPAAAPARKVTVQPTRIIELEDRAQAYSRSAGRVALPGAGGVARHVTVKAKPAPPRVTGRLWLTAPLNVWSGPGEDTHLVTVLHEGDRIPVTGAERGSWAEIVRGDQGYWVHAAYLSRTKPLPKPKPKPKPATSSRPTATSTATGGAVLSAAPCATGSAVESGIVSDAIALHRAVCAHFPQVKTYGGWRNDGEHADGHAVDIMVFGDSATGQAVADWVRANASILKVDDVIWSQHIWTTQRASEGWRTMPDRGSVTANHYDHVHVRVF